jgi:hypothetical protein
VAVYTATWSAMTTGTALKTLCQIATSSGRRAEIIEWSVSWNGTSASAVPALIQLNRQTSAGTGGVAGTAFPQDLADVTPTTTVLTGPTGGTWTAEPTAGNIVYQDYYTPVGLGPFAQYPLGRGIIVPVSARIAIVCTVAVAVSAAGHLVWSE